MLVACAVRQRLPDTEFFQAANWVSNKAYAEKQIALSHKAKIRVMPLRVKVRAPPMATLHSWDTTPSNPWQTIAMGCTADMSGEHCGSQHIQDLLAVADYLRRTGTCMRMHMEAISIT